MGQRNRRNEIVVALVVVAAIALAFLFGLVLTLSTSEDEDDETTAATASPTLDRNLAIVSAASDTPQRIIASPSPAPVLVRSTLTPTQSVSASPSSTRQPTATDTGTTTPTPSLSSMLTGTHEPTIYPSQTVTATAESLASPTVASLTPSPSPTPTATPCVLQFNWPVYTVQKDDTLFELALESGIRVDILRKANCLTLQDEIRAGQALRVPPDSVLADYAPPEGCERSNIRITSPRPGQAVRDILRVTGRVSHARLSDYQLQLRPADTDEREYEMIFESDEEVPQIAELAAIPLSDVDPGLYWLRLEAFTPAGQMLSTCAVRIRIESSQN